MADSPILDYYRATDSGCNLQRIGETYVEDAYAIGMTKGWVLVVGNGYSIRGGGVFFYSFLFNRYNNNCNK